MIEGSSRRCSSLGMVEFLEDFIDKRLVLAVGSQSSFQ